MFPKLFSFGSFYLPTYGVMVALAFLAGLAITVKLARRSGLNAELMTNLAVYVALAGMLGAKLLMIVFDWNRYMANPGDIFSLPTLQAAGVFQGGLILALVTAFLYLRHQGLPPLATSDAFAPGLALGHAFARAIDDVAAQRAAARQFVPDQFLRRELVRRARGVDAGRSCQLRHACG